MSIWKQGAAVARRSLLDGRLISLLPVRVVKDAADLTILLLVPGTICRVGPTFFDRRKGKAESSRWIYWETESWPMRDWVWQENRFLIFHQPGYHYSVSLVWHHATDVFKGWYVNFERPFSRTHFSLDTLDLALDIVVHPNGKIALKDEDEYAEGIKRGFLEEQTVHHIEAEKTAVLHRIENNQAPFNDEWIKWRAPKTWDIPHIDPKWTSEGGSVRSSPDKP